MDEFIARLKSREIDSVIDVRSVPYSRFVPHFNRAELQKSLENEGIDYVFKGDILGGRPPEGFDAYLKSGKLDKQIDTIVPRLTSKSAIMCSETDYTKCHRRFIGSKLMDRGFKVSNIGKEMVVMEQQSLDAYK
jgi:uncharacterized protein (DUF488 family)